MEGEIGEVDKESTDQRVCGILWLLNQVVEVSHMRIQIV